MTKMFKIPFATQGDRVDVPDEPQADGSVSYNQGYGYDYERDQTTDPAAKDIEREKMNAVFHDITEATGEIQQYGVANWNEEGKPYPIRAMVYYAQKIWQSKIANNNVTPAAGTAWQELKADLTPGDIGAYTKVESDQRFQPLGNYAPPGDYVTTPVMNQALQAKLDKTQNLADLTNKQTAARNLSVMQYFSALSVDLNTLGAITSNGFYFQPSNAEASAANHYPISEAGTLVVTQSAYGCQQEYTTFLTGRKFVRGLGGNWNGSNGPWLHWKEFLQTTGNAATATKLFTPRTIGGTPFDGSANITPALSTAAVKLQTARTIAGVPFDGSANIAIPATNVGAYAKSESDNKYQPKGSYTPAGQAYTKAESDARYGVVNGLRRGGQQTRNPTDAWFGNWESPAGCVLTGINMENRSDGRKLAVYYRQLQYLNKQANAWVNVGD